MDRSIIERLVHKFFKHKRTQTPYAFILCAALLFTVTTSRATTNELPTLGNESSSLISMEQEKKLGRYWLNSLRAQVKVFENPIVEEYLAQLVYSLAPNSEVQDKDFRFVIVDSQALNAFAVPGSIIGINTGLFLHAITEQEFASVLAHELAHISQRHYARRLEKQQISTPLTLAGILASVIVAATVGSDAGLATLASTQALNAENQLSFSRQNEEEADRLGILTLYKSRYDPRAMPIMFERMYRQSRVQGNSIPEYLSTHPLSENRISDTRNRATQYPRRNYVDNIEYHISKGIIINTYAESESSASKYFQSLIDNGNTVQVDGAEFGLAYAHLLSNPKIAADKLEALLSKYPGQISLELTLAEALYNQGRKVSAVEKLKTLLDRNPNNYPITIKLSEIYADLERYSKAEKLLSSLTRAQAENPLVWYMLAEIHGLAGNIAKVHQARAEYFVLSNRLEESIDQLKLAQQKTKNSTRESTLIQERLDEVRQLKENKPF